MPSPKLLPLVTLMLLGLCLQGCCSTKPPTETPLVVNLAEVAIEPGPRPGTLLVSRAALLRLGDALLASRAALERCRAGLR